MVICAAVCKGLFPGRGCPYDCSGNHWQRIYKCCRKPLNLSIAARLVLNAEIINPSLAVLAASPVSLANLQDARIAEDRRNLIASHHSRFLIAI